MPGHMVDNYLNSTNAGVDPLDGFWENVLYGGNIIAAPL